MNLELLPKDLIIYICKLLTIHDLKNISIVFPKFIEKYYSSLNGIYSAVWK